MSAPSTAPGVYPNTGAAVTCCDFFRRAVQLFPARGYAAACWRPGVGSGPMSAPSTAPGVYPNTGAAVTCCDFFRRAVQLFPARGYARALSLIPNPKGEALAACWRHIVTAPASMLRRCHGVGSAPTVSTQHGARITWPAPQRAHDGTPTPRPAWVEQKTPTKNAATKGTPGRAAPVMVGNPARRPYF